MIVAGDTVRIRDWVANHNWCKGKDLFVLEVHADGETPYFITRVDGLLVGILLEFVEHK